MCFCCCFSCLRRGLLFCGVVLEFRTILLDEGECSNCGSGDFPLALCIVCSFFKRLSSSCRFSSRVSYDTEVGNVQSPTCDRSLQIDSVVCLSISTVSSASHSLIVFPSLGGSPERELFVRFLLGCCIEHEVVLYHQPFFHPSSSFVGLSVGESSYVIAFLFFANTHLRIHIVSYDCCMCFDAMNFNTPATPFRLVCPSILFVGSRRLPRRLFCVDV